MNSLFFSIKVQKLTRIIELKEAEIRSNIFGDIFFGKGEFEFQ